MNNPKNDRFAPGWPQPAGMAQRISRRHRRIGLRLPVAILYPEGSTGPGVLCNLSVSGAAVLAPSTPFVGDQIVLRAGDVGDLHAKIARLDPQGFAVRLAEDRQQRCRLADALTVFLNQPHRSARAVRYPQAREAVLQLDSGQVISAVVLDCSETGARLGTAAFPAIGASVRLGARRARVERHLPSGIAVSFTARSRE